MSPCSSKAVNMPDPCFGSSGSGSGGSLHSCLERRWRHRGVLSSRTGEVARPFLLRVSQAEALSPAVECGVLQGGFLLAGAGRPWCWSALGWAQWLLKSPVGSGVLWFSPAGGVRVCTMLLACPFFVLCTCFLERMLSVLLFECSVHLLYFPQMRIALLFFIKK